MPMGEGMLMTGGVAGPGGGFCFWAVVSVTSRRPAVSVSAACTFHNRKRRMVMAVLPRLIAAGAKVGAMAGPSQHGATWLMINRTWHGGKQNVGYLAPSGRAGA